jgi:hypothetical protein
MYEMILFKRVNPTVLPVPVLGVRVKSSGPLFNYYNILSSIGKGIDLTGVEGSLAHMIKIYNSTITNSMEEGIGFDITSSDIVEIVNNVISRNGKDGIAKSNSTYQVLI